MIYASDTVFQVTPVLSSDRNDAVNSIVHVDAYTNTVMIYQNIDNLSSFKMC